MISLWIGLALAEAPRNCEAPLSVYIEEVQTSGTELAYLCLADRDSQNYVGWRLYTLYLLVLQDSIFPGGSDYLYPTWLHVENRVKLQGTPLAHAWLVLYVVVVAALLIPRARAWRAKAALAPAAAG